MAYAPCVDVDSTLQQFTKTTEFLFINLESQLRLVAEVTGNSLSALLDSHPYHVHTHIYCIDFVNV